MCQNNPKTMTKESQKDAKIIQNKQKQKTKNKKTKKQQNKILFRPVPSCSVLFRPVPSCSVLFRPVPSCSVLFRPVPSCSPFFLGNSPVQNVEKVSTNISGRILFRNNFCKNQFLTNLSSNLGVFVTNLGRASHIFEEQIFKKRHVAQLCDFVTNLGRASHILKNKFSKNDILHNCAIL